jgi:hypothetical protein
VQQHYEIGKKKKTPTRFGYRTYMKMEKIRNQFIFWVSILDEFADQNTN